MAAALASEGALELKPECVRLEWDSTFFGCGIGRVTGKLSTPEQAERVNRWARSEAVSCVYFLADCNDQRSVQVAEQCGMSLVDVRLVFDRELAGATTVPLGKDTTVRAHRDADVTHLSDLSKGAFRQSRFFCDGHFSEERCEALYETWITKSCSGWADAVLVAEVRGEVAGYVTCHLTNEIEGRIGLIGVGRKYQGLGVGVSLVTSASNWFLARGRRRAMVPTQARNTAAQRLYQRCGFVTRTAGLWYHWWIR